LQEYGLVKLQFNEFFLYCICWKETMKTDRNNVRTSKKFNLGSGDDIFLKTFGKMYKF